MRTIVTKAVKRFRLRRAKMCMHTYMHCNVHTPRWGGIYTTTPVQLRSDTPLGGLYRSEMTPRWGGVMTPRRGGVKKKFSGFGRIFLLHHPETSYTPTPSNSSPISLTYTTALAT